MFIYPSKVNTLHKTQKCNSKHIVAITYHIQYHTSLYKIFNPSVMARFN